MRTKMQALRAKTNKVVKLMIDEKDQPLVKEVEDNIASMGRNNTEGAYLLGQQLARVNAVLPEKTFGRWMKKRCGYTPRKGRYYVSIHENLQAFRERLVAAGVVPTVMFVLSSAALAEIEAVLSVFENGQRLNVGQVKHMMKPQKEASEQQPTEVGGAAGLRRAAEAKLKAELELFTKLVKRSHKAVELIVADIRNGKHVAKTKVAAVVEKDCQQAGMLLSAVISPRGSDAPLPIEWVKARQIISRLGDSPRYPGREEFHDWVVEEVLPALRFVVLGEASSGTAGSIGQAAVGIVDEGENNTAAHDADPATTSVADEPANEEIDGGAGDHAKEAPARTRVAKVPSIAPVELSAPEPEVQTEGAVNV